MLPLFDFSTTGVVYLDLQGSFCDQKVKPTTLLGSGGGEEIMYLVMRLLRLSISHLRRLPIYVFDVVLPRSGPNQFPATNLGSSQDMTVVSKGSWLLLVFHILIQS